VSDHGRSQPSALAGVQYRLPTRRCSPGMDCDSPDFGRRWRAIHASRSSTLSRPVLDRSGSRREEVAMLAGVSADYYVRLGGAECYAIGRRARLSRSSAAAHSGSKIPALRAFAARPRRGTRQRSFEPTYAAYWNGSTPRRSWWAANSGSRLKPSCPRPDNRLLGPPPEQRHYVHWFFLDPPHTNCCRTGKRSRATAGVFARPSPAFQLITHWRSSLPNCLRRM
jgi:hypothetical protein